MSFDSALWPLSAISAVAVVLAVAVMVEGVVTLVVVVVVVVVVVLKVPPVRTSALVTADEFGYTMRERYNSNVGIYK